MYKSFSVLVYGLCNGVHESSATGLMNLALSCREDLTKLQPSPDAAAIILTLDHQELSATEWPPHMNLLEAS